MMVSVITLVLPYGLWASSLVVSGIGMTGGVPYTVAEEEYTILLQSNSSIIWSSDIEAETLLA